MESVVGEVAVSARWTKSLGGEVEGCGSQMVIGDVVADCESENEMGYSLGSADGVDASVSESVNRTESVGVGNGSGRANLT